MEVVDLDMGERHGSLYVHADKGDRDCDIPLNNDVRQALRRWLQVRPVTTHDVVFTGKGGAPLGVVGVEYLCRSTDHRAGARAAWRGCSATDV
jgi:site-specific recombinase XerC